MTAVKVARMTSQIRHDEAVVAPRWLVWLGLVFAALAGLAVSATLRDASLALSERLLMVLTVLGAGFAVGAVALVFSRLRVEAGPDGVRAGFGPFRSMYRAEAIEGATPDRYRWLRFGGWGIRWSWNLRDRAYSVPFVARGVTIRLQGGRTVFLSSHEPEHLAATITAWVRPRGGAGAS
jgi:hypothetical protein